MSIRDSNDKSGTRTFARRAKVGRSSVVGLVAFGGIVAISTTGTLYAQESVPQEQPESTAGPSAAPEESSSEEDRTESSPEPPIPPPLEEPGASEESTTPPPDAEPRPTVQAKTNDASAKGASFRVHGTLVGAKAVSGYQGREFGFGGGALGAIEWGPTPIWGIQAELGFVGLAGNKKAPPAGLEELQTAAGGHLAAGVRVRPFAESKFLKYPAGPWVSAGVGASVTGGTVAPMMDAFLGYDFALPSRMSLGPTIGYMLVLQTQDSPRPENANLLLVGLHGAFDFGSPAPKKSDRDQDGILDEADGCPDAPEDRDGFEDEDGCPDPDNDEDGIVDAADHCPLDPEDVDGFEDEDGCPDPDNDGDDILDEEDECRDEPEDRDDFRDEDGCPDLDNDLDGIPDLKDLCPNEPETRNGIADNDGCPDEESVRVVGDKIELDQKIHFWTNSAKIRGMSYPVLEKLAQFLINHPEYVHISVEGHADARGEEAFNLQLSKDRAGSVSEFLAKRGVEEERLSSEGYGASRPLVEGKTEHAWFMNRRVEFVVTRNRTVSFDPKTGVPLQAQASEKLVPIEEVPPEEVPFEKGAPDNTAVDKPPPNKTPVEKGATGTNPKKEGAE